MYLCTQIIIITPVTSGSKGNKVRLLLITFIIMTGSGNLTLGRFHQILLFSTYNASVTSLLSMSTIINCTISELCNAAINISKNIEQGRSLMVSYVAWKHPLSEKEGRDFN